MRKWVSNDSWDSKVWSQISQVIVVVGGGVAVFTTATSGSGSVEQYEKQLSWVMASLGLLKQKNKIKVIIIIIICNNSLIRNNSTDIVNYSVLCILPS